MRYMFPTGETYRCCFFWRSQMFTEIRSSAFGFSLSDWTLQFVCYLLPSNFLFWAGGYPVFLLISAPKIPRTRFDGRLEDLSHPSLLCARKGKRGGGVGEWAICGERGRGERRRECEQMVEVCRGIRLKPGCSSDCAMRIMWQNTWPGAMHPALQDWVHVMRINQPHLPISLHAPC